MNAKIIFKDTPTARVPANLANTPVKDDAVRAINSLFAPSSRVQRPMIVWKDKKNG